MLSYNSEKAIILIGSLNSFAIGYHFASTCEERESDDFAAMEMIHTIIDNPLERKQFRQYYRIKSRLKTLNDVLESENSRKAFLN